jgi:hypothetical protein
MGSSEHLIERRTLRFCAADSVSVFVNDLKTALFCQPSQIKRLCLRILIAGGNSDIQGGSLHRIRSSVQG